jgi:hypothetical protein
MPTEADVPEVEESPTSRGPSAAPRWLLLASGAVLIVGSSLSFYELELGGTPDSGLGAELLLDDLVESSWTAWSNAWSIVPLLPLVVVVLPLLSTLWVAAGARGPTRLGGVPGSAVRTVVAVLALATVVAYLLRTVSGNDADGSLDPGPGAWVLLAGTVLHLAGALLAAWQEAVPAPEPPPVPEDGLGSTALFVTLGAAAVTLVGSFLPALTLVNVYAEVPREATALAWSDGLRPVFGLPALAGVAVVAVLLLHERGVVAPLRVPWTTWRLAASGFAVVASIAIVLGDPLFEAFSDATEVRFGQWVVLAGAFGMLAGTLADRRATSLS